MSKPTVRRLFVAAFLFLPLQYALVGVVGLTHGEPWPAIVMPGFQQVWEAGDAIVVPRPRFEAVFADGHRQAIPVEVMLEALPRTHHRAVMDLQFRPATFGGSAPVRSSSAHADWAATRVHTLIPERRAVRLDVVWERVVFEPGAAAHRSPTLVPVDTLRIALPDRDR